MKKIILSISITVLVAIVYFNSSLANAYPNDFGNILSELLQNENSNDIPKDIEADNDGDSTKKKQIQDSTLKYPITDRRTDAADDIKPKEFDLKDPANLKTEYVYDSSGNKILITEKMGSFNYRNPSYMTLEEFTKYKGRLDEEAYWRKRASSFGVISKKGNTAPGLDLGDELFDRVFGKSGIEVKPTGNLNLSLGGKFQNVQNPNLPLNQRKWGIFDFDVQPNLNMLAKVGDKMRFNFNFNSKATFNFENRTKLEYAGQEDHIIKKVEAGNVGFQSRSKLISGVQGIFGARTQLQFGRLMLNAVAGQQNSKKESITLKGGAQAQEYNITADNYDLNRHFFLDQFSRNNYNKALEELPLIKSQATITKIEVWITNRSGSTNDIRDVLAFADLGEPEPYLQQYKKVGNGLPGNGANNLYNTLNNEAGIRNISSAITIVNGLGLKPITDFEKVFARKLQPNDFTFQPRLGYINLNVSLNPDDVVGVAYQYTYNGRSYQVGEFAQDLPPDTLNPKVLLLKMLKSTSYVPNVPMWDLMMKNVYNIGGGNVNKEDFKLNIFYKDAAGMEKRYMPEGPFAGKPNIDVFHLDRLNNQNDPQPDGVFDFVEGVTVYANQGKIVFPVIEPFGEDLRFAFGNNTQLEKKYLFPQLYDSTLFVAQQYPQLNRFIIKGSYKGTGGSEIYLGGFNIPQGSVTVSAGGAQLVENVDYTIDYNIGKVTILNSGILSSGVPINISYENNANFGFQQQNFTGLRADYFVNQKFNIGSTIQRLTERPFTNKVLYGDDPIKNTALGLDFNYQTESKLLTRLVDKLPIYSTTAPSLINAGGEVATMIPGSSKLIGDDGNVYIEDFEGARSGFDLKFPLTAWTLASPPVGSKDANGIPLFPEASETGNLNSGMNRALMSWYFLDPSMSAASPSTPEHLRNDKDQLSDPYIHPIQQNKIFPARQAQSFGSIVTTLDLAFYPQQRGPYNFDTRNIDNNGRLLNPRNRWAGITRYIDQSDFENSNVQFIEFWLMDPFLKNPGSNGGSLNFNLGLISEDILKDSRKSFENGIPFPFIQDKMEPTAWGQVPKFQQQINNAFDNDNAARARQDVGIDGMNNTEEAAKFSAYLNDLKNVVGASSPAFVNASKDPANDDFQFFQSDSFNTNQTPVFERYKRFNNTEGNSPVISNNNSLFSSAFSNLPESEDINRDNTLNENESYFQYLVQLRPNMQVGESYIVSKQSDSVDLPNGKRELETWYQFKVPIRDYTNKVGNINDFRSIRFMRMFLNGFEDSVVLRFARLELSRSTWRKYNFSMKSPGEIVPEIDLSATTFNLNNVSLEENGTRQPIPYLIPPGIQRQQQQVSNGTIIPINEQSMSMEICNLEDGDSRGAFKQIDMDLRQFQKLRFFVHAEGPVNRSSLLADGDLRGFIRLGNDFNTNFYEYQIPLKVTSSSSTTAEQIWPIENRFEITLKDFVELKKERDIAKHPFNIIYEKKLSSGHVLRIIGNPNLGDVRMAMLGVNNPKKKENTADDGLAKCGEIWFNELRVTNMNQKPGYAATAFADVQLADLATVRFAGNMHTMGYGSVEQKLNARFRDNYTQYSLSTNINAGKLFPKNWGVQLPIFVGQSSNVSAPQFDPYNLDIPLSEKLASLPSSERDSFKNVSQDITKVRSINVTNARINPVSKDKDATTGKAPWSPRNFDVSYSYSNTDRRSPLLVFDNLTDQMGEVGYNYAPKVKNFEPFKKSVKSKNKKLDKYLVAIRDFNIKPLPTNITVRNSIHRLYSETQVRNVEDLSYQLPTTYFKFFTWNRTYSMRWNLANSLSVEYTANNSSRVDEPDGAINTKAKRDSVFQNMARFGRNTLYGQTFNVNYNMPLNKFPLLDWVSMRTSYQSTYNWTAASRVTFEQGNLTANTQVKQLNGDFNFANLYNKVGILKKANAPKPPAKPAPKSATSKATPAADNKGKGDEKNSGKKGDPKTEKSNSRDNKNQKSSSETKNDRSANSKGAPSADTKNADPKANEPKAEDVKANASSTKPNANPNAPNVTVQSPTAPTANTKGGKKSSTDTVKGKNFTAKLTEYDKKKLAEEKKKKKLAKIAARKAKPLPDGVRIGLQLLTSVKRANFSYMQNMGSTLPGFMDSTQFFGANFRNAPQWGYAFGAQPTRGYLDNLGGMNLLSRDSLFNTNFTQSLSRNLTITATLEPIKGMNINLNATKNLTKNYTELYKDTTGNSGLQHLNPLENGSLTMTFVSFKTMFMKADTGGFTAAFYAFENNRKVISERLGLINPYVNGAVDPNDPEYKKGYNRYAQEVLIPSLLSAYTGKDARTYPLQSNNPFEIKSNPFRFIKMAPNWRFSYNGLNKLNFIKDRFSNVNLTHGYTNTLNMNNFSSSLFYQDAIGVGFPSFIDSVSNNFVPYFFVPNITITEAFSPLIGIDVASKGGTTFHFEYKRTRSLLMNLLDFQLNQTTSKEIIFGAGARLKKVTVPLPIFDVNTKKTDINFKLDFSIRDDKSAIQYMDTRENRIVRGQYVLGVHPSIDYIYSKYLTLRFYYDLNKSVPYTSNSFPITATRGGVMFRFILGN